MNTERHTHTPELSQTLTASADSISTQISKITHEIRNPVALIHSYLQLIEAEHPEITACSYWNHAISNMQFLISLLNEISALNNASTLNKTYVNVYSFFQVFVDEMAPVLKERNIQLFLKKKTALPPLLLDLTKFRQVMLNLIRNSQDAIGQNGQITISLSFQNLSFYIEVEDNGCGIPDEYLPTLFEPFVTHKTNGTGLGLSIVKNIIEAHGGTIHAESLQGQRTRFILQLPY